jgi:hypothetical protein
MVPSEANVLKRNLRTPVPVSQRRTVRVHVELMPLVRVSRALRNKLRHSRDIRGENAVTLAQITAGKARNCKQNQWLADA